MIIGAMVSAFGHRLLRRTLPVPAQTTLVPRVWHDARLSGLRWCWRASLAGGQAMTGPHHRPLTRTSPGPTNPAKATKQRAWSRYADHHFPAGRDGARADRDAVLREALRQVRVSACGPPNSPTK
jgi:hypothetical protein